jgi:hypothetical protein
MDTRIEVILKPSHHSSWRLAYVIYNEKGYDSENIKILLASGTSLGS